MSGFAPIIGIIGSLASAMMGSKGAPSAPQMMAPPPPPAPAPAPAPMAPPPPENTISPDASIDAEAARQQSLKRRQAQQASSNSLLGDALESASPGNKNLLGQ